MGDLFPKRLIETASAPFYIDLLEPYATHCKLRGVRLEGPEVGSSSWYRHLDALFNAPDAERPESLAEALGRIAQLASEAGHARIQEVVLEQQTRLVDPDERLTPTELSLRAFLRARRAFELAFARHRASFTRRFVELTPRHPSPLGPRITPERVEQLRRAVADYYFSRNHTAFADVDVRRSPASMATTFMLVHGRAPRIVGIIDEAEQRRALRQVHDKQDMVHVCDRTGRLGVSVGSVAEERAIVGLFGEAFFGDVEHYQAVPIYSGQPILEQGVGALDPTGVEGIEAVKLKRLLLRADEAELHLFADQVQALWHQEWFQLMLSRAEVAALHLQATVCVGGRRSIRSVTVRPPNRIELDRRGPSERILRTFLERRGFALDLECNDGWTLVDAA